MTYSLHRHVYRQLTSNHVSVLFKELILRNGGRLAPTLDLSSLAKISDGYTPGHIITAVKHVLTERRVQQVRLSSFLSFESTFISLQIDLSCLDNSLLEINN